MTVTQYLRVLRQHWLIVAILAVLGIAGAAAYTGQQIPVYQAQTQLFVSAQGGGSQNTLSDLSESSTFSQQRVKSYAGMVTSSAVTEPVVKRLRLPYTPAELAGQIDASPQLDTVLIDITVSDPDPQRAADVARAAAVQLQTVVNDLESNNGRTQSSVKLTVTRPPTVPTVPVSPRVPLNIALGLLLGLGLGVGAAVLRDQLNTTLRGSSDVELLTGSVPLGVVPFDAAAPKQPLVTADAFGGRAEAFRTLRTNLQFADVDNPPRVIAVTSALPDEGKTTTACNIALILAQSGARVVLVEGDLRKPAVGKYLGISNAAGLTNVLAGQHDLRDVVVGYERDLLAVLPSGPTPPNPSELLGSQQMRHLLNTLAEHYDVVIIDAPPLLPVTDAALIATAADGAILVIRHGRSRREEGERAIKALEAVSAKLLGTVLNFAPRKKGRNGYRGYGYGYGYGQPPANQVDLTAADPATVAAEAKAESTSRRGRRGRKAVPEAPAAPTAPAAIRVVMPDAGAAASLPLAPVDPDQDVQPPPENWQPEDDFGTTVGKDRPGGGSGPRSIQLNESASFKGDSGPDGRGPGRGFERAPERGRGRDSGRDLGRDFERDETRMAAAPQGPAPAGPQAPGAATADMGWAPSPSDGWAPIAGSLNQSPRTAEESGTGGISVFGGLSSTGPLPVITNPGTDGLAVISRTEGLEVSRTVDPESAAASVISQRRPDRLEVRQHGEPDLSARRRGPLAADQVPEELRLQPLPNETAATPEPPRERRGSNAPDTAPSGIQLGTAASGLPSRAGSPQSGREPGHGTGSAPGAELRAEPQPQSWTQASWFDAVPDDSPEARPAPEEFEEIPPLLVDLSAPDLDLLEDERELLIPPQSVMPHVPTGVPRHHRSKRSL